MAEDFCVSCGILLSPYTRICSVCGFDNNDDQYPSMEPDIDQLIDSIDEFIPDNDPGY